MTQCKDHGDGHLIARQQFADANGVLKLKDAAAVRAKLADCPEVKAMAEAKAQFLRWRQQRNTWEGRRWLHKTFPKCFAGLGKPKWPIKIGTSGDIFARYGYCGSRFSSSVRFGLQDYTTGKSYLAAMIVGAVRLDLDGNPAGIVTERDAAHAAKRLAKVQRREAEIARQQQKKAA
jgi:hypothetical protein